MSRWRHLVAGLYWGYPLCCILRFTFSRSNRQGRERGSRVVPNPPGTGVTSENRCVNCGVFHR